jgi:competence protein ComEC
MAYLFNEHIRFSKGFINSPMIKSLFVFILSAVLSLCYASSVAQAIIDTRLQNQFEGKDLIVEGIIDDIPQYQQDRWRFYLKISQVKLAQGETSFETIQLNGKIKLSWYHQQKSAKKTLQAGQKWRFQVRLKQPNGFMNEGGLDYEKWLFINRIKATGYIRRSDSNVRLEVAPWYSINYQRQQLANKIKRSFVNDSTASTDNHASAIITALAVASRHDMSESQWQLFRQTGTSHLIAISGLHIGIVAGFGYLLIMALWWLFPTLYQQVPVRIAGAFLAVILATSYALLAGFTLPTQRSLMMVIGVVIVLVQRQRVHTVNILSLTLIAILLIDPLATMSASFWLSFSAVILILLFANKQLKKPRFSLLSLQLMLSFGMFPLTIFFFGSISLISPIANLIAIPWVTIIIVPLILLAMLFFLIAPALSTYLLQFVAFNIDCLVQVLTWLDALPFTMLHFQALPTSLILVMMASLLFLFLPKGFPAKWLGILLLIPLFSYQPQRLEKGEFKYSLLDVGQGLASLIETKNHTLLYDTGPRTNSRFDTGKLVVLPFLQSKGITQIDKMVLSHEDMDHRVIAPFYQFA